MRNIKIVEWSPSENDIVKLLDMKIVKIKDIFESENIYEVLEEEGSYLPIMKRNT